MSGKAFTFLLLVIIKHSTSIRVFSLKYLNVLLFQQSRITANLFAIKISSLSVAIKFPVKIYALSPDQYLNSHQNLVNMLMSTWRSALMICAFGVFTLFGALTAVCELGFLQEICSTITSPNKLDLMMVVLSAILIFLGVWALEQV